MTVPTFPGSCTLSRTIAFRSLPGFPQPRIATANNGPGLLFIGVLTASALVLNDRLIGPMSINGAAMATLLSYAIYFALLLAFLWRRLRVSLFSGAQLKTLAVMAAAFALDWGWRSWLTPLVATGGMAPMLADAVLKTAVLASAAAAAMVAWKVSPTVNDIVARFLHKNHR